LIELVVIVVAGVAYLFSFPQFSWNQKLTVEVETPEGVKSGSSVVGITISYRPTFGLPEASNNSKGWRGEATIVELPEKKYLFALLGDPVAMTQFSFKSTILGSSDARFPVWRNISQYCKACAKASQWISNNIHCW